MQCNMQHALPISAIGRRVLSEQGCTRPGDSEQLNRNNIPSYDIINRGSVLYGSVANILLVPSLKEEFTMTRLSRYQQVSSTPLKYYTQPHCQALRSEGTFMRLLRCKQVGGIQALEGG